MSRPFIEFVQCQALPWQRGLYGGARTGTEVRMLSLDEDSGASSVMIRYPPGWRRPEQEQLSAAEELLVLRGWLEIGGTRYGPFSYANLPAGYPRTMAAAPGGALALSFFSAEPAPAAARSALDVPEPVKVDGFDGPWTGNFHPQFPPGAGRKWLKRDPVTGEETWLLGTMPLRNGRRAEKHPVVEEMFLISGALVGPLGTMYPGCYFWRPPEEWHGPFGTLTGNIELFRTIGGPLSTEYRDEDAEFRWDPAYRPILPPDLSGAAERYPDCLAGFAALGPDVFEAG